MRTLLHRLALVASVLAGAALVPEAARADGGEPPLRVPETRQRYALEATLDPRTHVVHGRAHVHFVNESREPLGELLFHLYLNAFRDEHTVFARESEGQLRGVSRRGSGGIDLRALVVDGEDRLADARTDLVPHDATQMRVPLARALPPGASIDLELTFDARLPPLYARAGYERDFHVVAQWFPKLAKLEPDGTWAGFPYHGNGEFYADFAEYTLEVTTPRDFVIASGGELESETAQGDSIVRRFHARPVHDAMFVAMRSAGERTSRCDDVALRVVFPHGFEDAAARHQATTCDGLRYFSTLYGRYPYPTLTVVVPPPGASGGAGMEYPALFLTSGPWYSIAHVTRELAEATTAHELAHQWFQGIVATNELAYPWLDEGLTSFVSSDFLSSVDPPPFDHEEAVRSASLKRDLRGPGLPANRYTPEDYGRSVYGFSELLFESIARTWGRDRTRVAIGSYARAHAFGHPTPGDLYEAFDRTYWDGFSRDVLVPAIERGERPKFRVEGPIPRDAQTVRFVVKRSGHLGFPTHVAITDGARELRRIPFPAGARERVVDVPRDGRTCVWVDPDRHLLLDERRRDDRACTKAPVGGSSWWMRIVPTVQWILQVLSP